MPGKDKHIA